MWKVKIESSKQYWPWQGGYKSASAAYRAGAALLQSIGGNSEGWVKIQREGDSDEYGPLFRNDDGRYVHQMGE